MKHVQKYSWLIFLISLIIICMIIYALANFFASSHLQSAEELQKNGEFSGLTAEFDSELASLVPQSIRDKGKLVAGSQTGYAPNEFVASDNKTVVGFEIELFRLICEQLGLEGEISYSSFDQIIPAIGKLYDVGVSGFTVSKERAQIVNFVPFYSGGESFAYASNKSDKFADSASNPITNPLSLCGLNVGVQTNTAQDEELDDYNAVCKEQGLSEINVMRWQEEADAYIALLGAKVDLVYADTAVVDYAITKTALNSTDGEAKIAKFPTEMNTALQGMVFAKDNVELANVFAKCLQKLLDSGTYEKLYDYWNVKHGAINSANVIMNEDDEVFKESE